MLGSKVKQLKQLDFWAGRRMCEPLSGILACCSHQTRSPHWLEACLHQTLISRSSALNAAVVDQVWGNKPARKMGCWGTLLHCSWQIRGCVRHFCLPSPHWFGFRGWGEAGCFLSRAGCCQVFLTGHWPQGDHLILFFCKGVAWVKCQKLWVLQYHDIVQFQNTIFLPCVNI